MSITTNLVSLACVFAMGAAFNNPLWTDEGGATKTLTDAGLTPVEVGGYGWFNGGAGDLYKTEFNAVNQNGTTVKGVVTHGLLFKGSTIRYE